MRSFTDKLSRAWNLCIDVLAIKRVRAGAGVDLMTVLDGKEASEKLSDPCTLVDVLWVLVEPQATPLKISAEEFGRSLDGDTFDAASRQLLEAVIDFFPSPRRTILRGLLEKTSALMDKRMGLAALDMERLDLEKLLENQGAKKPGA